MPTESEPMAKYVRVAGTFNGNIKADKIHILSTGCVQGPVLTSSLVIDSGGYYGSLHPVTMK